MIPNNKRKSEPDLCVLFDKLADEIKSSLSCVLIGTIQTFYPEDQTADIFLNYKRVSLYQEGSSGITDYPILVKCPVVVLGGGVGYVSFPITSGDSCLVFFCDREIDTWFTNGGINAPQSARIHDLNDGIALVGIKNALNSLASYYSNGVRVKCGSGYVTIDLSGNVTISSPSISVTSSGGLSLKGSTVDMFGAWTTVSDTVAHQAPSDGFVVVHQNSTGGGSSYILTDSNPSPSTERIKNSYGGCMCPVKKNDYYRGYCDTGAGSAIVYFIPISS
jgi:hypothetical protein